jgi:hypothetical protein
MVGTGSYKDLGIRALRRIGTATVNMDRNQDNMATASVPETETRPLTPEARRALAEAEARRQQATPQARPTEVGGRTGPEPTRFGDWETGGIASDF